LEELLENLRQAIPNVRAGDREEERAGWSHSLKVWDRLGWGDSNCQVKANYSGGQVDGVEQQGFKQLCSGGESERRAEAGLGGTHLRLLGDDDQDGVFHCSLATREYLKMVLKI
jgi:hypothetical protein